MPKPKVPSDPSKQPFRITRALSLVRKAIEGYPRAAMFELRDEGFDSVFELLAACIVSIRTLDEVSLPVARTLFASARTPAAVAALSVERIAELIAPCMYAFNKAAQIRDIAKVALEQHGGVLPCDRDVLLSLRGVGPKCANLVLGVACGESVIGVDIHVHRITNRWGYVSAKTPEKTLEALEEKLPARHRIEINELLVPFGKHVCMPTSPRCSTCPLLSMCRQAGVTTHR